MLLFKKNTIWPSAWVEVDLKALKHNFHAMQKFVKQNKFLIPTRKKFSKQLFTHQGILPVIKADAYGHGVEQIARLLDKEDVDCFGVFSLQEGVLLRKQGIARPILILENIFQESIPALVEHRLTPTIGTMDLAIALNEYAKKRKKQIQIHIKVDTGMGRLGVPQEKAFDFIENIFHLKNLTIYGIYTHFPVADTDKAFTQQQVKALFDLVVQCDKKGMIIPYVHASNSMGLAGYRTKVLNLSRPGLMLYGLYPDNRLKNKVKLKPVMAVKSRVSFLKVIKKDQGVSYGRSFVAKKKTPVAIIPLGYNDGYLRAFSNKSSVLIKGNFCKVLGHVTMNQIIVDVSRVKDIKIGDEVVVLGKQRKKEITADDLAKLAGTINYEIVCSLGNRLPRRYV